MHPGSKPGQVEKLPGAVGIGRTHRQTILFVTYPGI